MLVPTPKNCDISVKKAIQLLSTKLDYDASPTFQGLTLRGLTASTLIGANASKLLESVTVGTGLDYTRPNLTLSHLGIEDLTDPGADRIFFWDNSASASKWLGVGNSIAITTTTIDTIQDIRTSASPQFTGIELGHATDTTITRASAGNLNIEGNLIYRAGGTDVPLTDGGTGASSAVDARTNLGLVIGTDVQAFGAALDDLSALTPPASDGQFIVATGAGAFAYESGATVRTSIGLGTTDTPQFAKLTVQDITIETTIGYVGFYNDHRKTAGVTDHLDYFYGHQNYIVYNQTGGIIGTSCAFYNQFSLVDGNIGDVSNSKNLNGVYSFVDLDAGKVYGNVFGFQTVIDQEAASEVTGNIYGNYIDIDADGTVGGLVYGLYFNEGSNVDYGIYQNGTAPNVFGGNIIIADGGTMGQADGPLLNFDNTNNFLEITGCDVIIGGTIPRSKLHVRTTNDSAIDWSAMIQNLHALENMSGTGVGLKLKTYSDSQVEQNLNKWTGIASESQATPTYGKRVDQVFYTVANAETAAPTEKMRLTGLGTIKLLEAAAADGDTAAYGQIWVKTATPNELWFTNDAGGDFQIGGAMASIVMTDGGTIGQAAGPLLTFDDTNDHLHITGCKVGIGGTHTPGQALDVRSTSSSFGDGRYNMFFFDNTPMAAGVGAGMVFGGCYTAAGAQTSFAIIWGEKENANEADFAGQLHLGTRVAAGSVSSDLIINSLGNVDVPSDFTAGTIQADDGFTGTGAYTNFTIVGGIITAAS